MPKISVRIISFIALLVPAACSAPPSSGDSPAPASSGGSTGRKTGGSSGNSSTGGSAAGGSSAAGGASGGATATSGGTSGQATGGQTGGRQGGDNGAGGTTGAPDAETGGASGDAGAPAAGGSSGGDGGGGPIAPPVAGQGPVAEGKLVFSQDFEQNMDGMSRSPNGLPAERIQIIDDPIKQRGKIVAIKYMQGDNFRTSAGTEPRSWFSSAMGYTAKPNSTVSVAWGFMWENVSMGAHFAQIIRDGGPLWMMDVDTAGNVRGDVHRGSGSTGTITKLEPMKWYDFRVDTDYKAGGAIKFYLNGKMVGQGQGDGGGNGRFDCGIYWGHGAKATRTVYVSNVSIAEQ
jgi:hypothetical protein